MTQPDIEAATEEQLWVRDGLATIICDSCDGSGYHGLEGSEEHPKHPCPKCKDKGPIPGRIWALPGMQEKCLWCSGAGQLTTGRSDSTNEWGAEFGPCAHCHGSGYVPKRDLWALVEKLNYISIDDRGIGALGGRYYAEIRLEHGQRVWSGRGDTSAEALLRAVAKALQAQGATLREVPDA